MIFNVKCDFSILPCLAKCNYRTFLTVITSYLGCYCGDLSWALTMGHLIRRSFIDTSCWPGSTTPVSFVSRPICVDEGLSLYRCPRAGVHNARLSWPSDGSGCRLQTTVEVKIWQMLSWHFWNWSLSIIVKQLLVQRLLQLHRKNGRESNSIKCNSSTNVVFPT